MNYHNSVVMELREFIPAEDLLQDFAAFIAMYVL